MTNAKTISEKVTELASLIEKEISYDASGYSPEKVCPHCGKVIEAKSTWGYWIDHRGVLTQSIVNFLGLGSTFRAAIDELLSNASVTGNRKVDSVEIAKEILDQ